MELKLYFSGLRLEAHRASRRLKISDFEPPGGLGSQVDLTWRSPSRPFFFPVFSKYAKKPRQKTTENRHFIPIFYDVLDILCTSSGH